MIKTTISFWKSEVDAQGRPEAISGRMAPSADNGEIALYGALRTLAGA